MTPGVKNTRTMHSDNLVPYAVLLLLSLVSPADRGHDCIPPYMLSCGAC